MRAVIIAVCVVIVLIIASWVNTYAYEDYLYGFWLADGDEFCELSDIESMLVFIGPPTGYWYKERSCYIIIMNDLCNQGFTLTYRPAWARLGLGKYSVCADVVFDDEKIWDDNVKIIVDVTDGTLKILSHDDTLYAALHKQHDTTNIARQMESVELAEGPVEKD